MALKNVPRREDVPTNLTWDLTVIFENDQVFEEAVHQIQTGAATFETLKGTLTTGPAVLTAVQQVFALERQLEKVYVYASLKNDQDTSNAVYQSMQDQASALAATVSAQTAWFEPELLAIPEATLQNFIATTAGLNEYRQYFATLNEQRGHVLSTAEERLLAGASDIFGASAKTFGVLDNADLQFPTVQDEDGQELQLTNGLYAVLLESTKRSVRQEAFEALYQVYQQFRHTFASTLSSHVKSHNFSAQTRHYASARQSSLSRNHIPESVFTTLVSTVNDHLPSLHRYVALRKELLRLDTMHMYDLYTPITGTPSLTYTYDEAKKTALQALAVLGDDYVKHVAEMFDKRAIDVVENVGKRSGAYSGGMYDTPPYILLNWQDSLESLYTLVHEMGHSMHSYYTRHEQPYQYGDYSIFVAEIASTTNENLLTAYLLKTQTDPKVRAYILNHYLDGFKGTVYRQTQFAEFEDYIHQQDAVGVPLTADLMSHYYGELNARYYGDAVISDPQIADEWTRIPHFYYDYYVYQYATGFAAATTLAQRILSGNIDQRDAYLNYLKAGSSDMPLNVMRRAGVDMTAPDYLAKAFATFDERLTEFQALMSSGQAPHF